MSTGNENHLGNPKVSAPTISQAQHHHEGKSFRNLDGPVVRAPEGELGRGAAAGPPGDGVSLTRN
jgi:hypothetical protein